MKIKHTFIVHVLTVFCSLSCPLMANAQIVRDTEFKEKYQLKEVVVLSRHNIRSPLSTNGSTLEKMTTHTWTTWSSKASELTLRGGILETMMGQYFRKWLTEAGMFTENQIPNADEVHVYANSMQRTIATAQYFTSGFMPVANLRVTHRMEPSKMDPVFAPRLTKVSKAFTKQALKEIKDMYGKKSLIAITDSIKTSYQVLADVLDLKESPAYKSGEITDFSKGDLQISFEKDKEPSMKGGLKLANAASDALVLQYYEETNEKKAAFGNSLSAEEWEKIARIKDLYGDILFTAPIVAYNVAHPLLVYINDELNLNNRKFTFLCGHDSNIASVTAALNIENYELPNTIEKKTPIGCKLVFEKWVDKEEKEYIAINLVYQSKEQLRTLQLLDLDTPPMIFPLKLRHITPNAEGLYRFEEVQGRFNTAISSYDTIK